MTTTRNTPATSAVLRAAARHRREVGAFGERLAASFLEARGVRVFQHNVAVGRSELDLVCEIEGERAAVEVKTIVAKRADDDPLIHVDEVKLARVRAAAMHLQPAAFRIDVVAIALRTDHVEVRWIPRVG